VRELHAQGVRTRAVAQSVRVWRDAAPPQLCSAGTTGRWRWCALTRPTDAPHTRTHRAPRHHCQQRRGGRGLPAAGPRQQARQARAEAGAGSHRPGERLRLVGLLPVCDEWVHTRAARSALRSCSTSVESARSTATAAAARPTLPPLADTTVQAPQVHLMRYYEDILNALGLVSEWDAAARHSAAQRVTAAPPHTPHGSAHCQLRVHAPCRDCAAPRPSPPRLAWHHHMRADVRAGAADVGKPGRPQPIRQRAQHVHRAARLQHHPRCERKRERVWVCVSLARVPPASPPPLPPGRPPESREPVATDHVHALSVARHRPGCAHKEGTCVQQPNPGLCPGRAMHPRTRHVCATPPRPATHQQDTVAVQELRFGDNDTLSAQARLRLGPHAVPVVQALPWGSNAVAIRVCVCAWPLLCQLAASSACCWLGGDIPGLGWPPLASVYVRTARTCARCVRVCVRACVCVHAGGHAGGGRLPVSADGC
jgi:hypothetical protein